MTQAQEAFLAGHVHAFEAAGGVPKRIRYDNLKPAVARVLFGRDRVESERFVAFRSHYGFDSFYWWPGKEGAHEKGGVEQDIGWFRGNHLVPVPKVATLAQLNDLVSRYDTEDLARVIEGHRATVAVEFAQEQPLLWPLPAEAFDTTKELWPRVDAKARVCVRQCRYSVPVSLVGRRLLVRLGATDVVVVADAKVVARHQRLVQRGEESLQLDHYLEILQRKPGAFPSSVPLAHARASGAFSEGHERYWAQARRQLGDQGGTKALIEVLLLQRTLPLYAMLVGVDRALALGTVAPEVVAVEARRAAGDHLAPIVPIEVATTARATLDLTRYDRPTPDLRRYDGLLGPAARTAPPPEPATTASRAPDAGSLPGGPR